MLNVVRIWILLSTLLVASGWVLSAFHELNPIGYGVVFFLAIVAFIFWQRKTKWQKSPAQLLQKFKRRFKRMAPLLFLILAVMSLAAGALYVPESNDSNEYRIPRVWHWLAEGHWHWIYTYDSRMNVAGCGYEWLMSPLMLFTKTDRFNFLVNWVSYLMLPGLIFSVFKRLGVRARVAWWWMWLLTSGWCYAMQAASDVNDSFGAIYALASVDLALRAREKNYLPDLWLAILSVALLTGGKADEFAINFSRVVRHFFVLAHDSASARCDDGNMPGGGAGFSRAGILFDLSEYREMARKHKPGRDHDISMGGV